MWQKNCHMWCWNCTRDVGGTVQCDDEIDKCGKKNKGTTKCDQNTVKCNVGTA